jgi:hypothetical protein
VIFESGSKLPEYFEIERDPGNGPLWIVLIAGLLLVAGVAWLNRYPAPDQYTIHQQPIRTEHKA